MRDPKSQNNLLGEWEKDIRTRWFKEHVTDVLANLAYPDDRAVQVIRWSKPGTNCYRTYYILHRNTLMVYGDIGEATYTWSEKIDIPFLKSCQFDYFAGKCQASETGRSYEQFSPEVAQYYMDDYVKDSDRSQNEEEVVELLKAESPDCKDEYQRIAERVYDLTADSELSSMVSRWGTVPNIRCLAHWVGLKMMSL